MKSIERRTGAVVSRNLGSNQVSIRNYNERVILDLVRRNRSISKAEATKATGLSANAISVIFRSLEKDGLLLRGEPIRGRVGQPTVPLSLNPEGAYYAGLKIGRKSTELVIIDFLGAVMARQGVFHTFPTPSTSLEFAHQAFPRALKEARVDRANIQGFGVAYPFELWSWADEVAVDSEELEGWRGLDVEAHFAALGDWPIHSGNDATAACGAELTFGPYQDRQDFMYLFVGAFIGGGVVLNGSVFEGRSGNAGGFGPMRLPGGEPGADRLVDVASLVTLERLIDAAGGDGSEIYKGDHAIWSEPSPLVERWLDKTAWALANAIISSVAVIDFEAVVVDGAFPRHVRDALVPRIRTKILELDHKGVQPPEIRPGSWGAIARAVGAATLPLSAQYSINQNTLLRG